MGHSSAWLSLSRFAGSNLFHLGWHWGGRQWISCQKAIWMWQGWPGMVFLGEISQEVWSLDQNLGYISWPNTQHSSVLCVSWLTKPPPSTFFAFFSWVWNTIWFPQIWSRWQYSTNTIWRPWHSSCILTTKRHWWWPSVSQRWFRHQLVRGCRCFFTFRVHHYFTCTMGIFKAQLQMASEWP